MKNIYLLAFLILILPALIPSTGNASQLKLSFAEVSQTADIIFIGTVSNRTSSYNKQRTMIYTDVVFSDIHVVSAKQRSIQKDSPTITLRYAGGEVGDTTVMVSDMPRFIEGSRYIVFAYDDGQTYINPVIGAAQGIFQIIHDEQSSDKYILTASGKAVTGLSGENITTGLNKVSSVKSGRAFFIEGVKSIEMMTEIPLSDDPLSSAENAFIEETIEKVPVVLNDFISFINEALQISIMRENIKNNQKVDSDEGEQNIPPGLYFDEDDNIDQEQIGVDKIVLHEDTQRDDIISSVDGGTLGVCGHQSIPFTIEQVDPSWREFGTNGNCINTWNQFMNIYTVRPFNGSWGRNWQSEICSFWRDEDLFKIYGGHWGGALAVTWVRQNSDCGRIYESDILFNAALNWTFDPKEARSYPYPYLYRPILMHELGHTWGYMNGTLTETYDYDFPTVMQGYYSEAVVEDGRGIHAKDAYYLRQNYENQLSPIKIKDIGIESYYASNGLQNAYTDNISYRPGDSIKINKFTVENMSSGTLIDVRIRFFLSKNTTISTTDYQIGSYWYWLFYWPNRISVNNISSVIPSSIPGGTYYVGAIITIEGFNSDDYAGNNTTFLYDPITILNHEPSISSISPNNATLGGDEITIIVNGSGFCESSTVRFNGSSLHTKYININQLSAVITASDLASAGTAEITVHNPSPGGGTSGAIIFTINNPVPVVTALEPSSALVGSSPFTMVVKGSGFVPTSSVVWNGSSLSTTYVSKNQLTVSIAASDVLSAGEIPITAFNPSPGGGTSKPVDFTINNPIPVITSISPGIAVAGGASFTLTIKGSLFINGATVYWNGSPRTTTFVNTSQLNAAINDSDLISPRTVSITICNPPPSLGAAQLPNGYKVAVAVYAGDANNDGDVDAADVLPIGRFYDMKGPGREQASLSWIPQPLPDGWSPNEAAFADCDGNGDINANDVKAIVDNWAKVRNTSMQPSINRSLIAEELLKSLATQVAPGKINDEICNVLRRIIEEEGGIPTVYNLEQNYPNPFNPSTTIRFDIPEDVASARISITNVLGQLIWEQTLTNLSAGKYSVNYNSESNAGIPTPSGTYYCRLTAGQFTKVIRMILIK